MCAPRGTTHLHWEGTQGFFLSFCDDEDSGLKPKASSMLSKCPTAEPLPSQPFSGFFVLFFGGLLVLVWFLVFFPLKYAVLRADSIDKTTLFWVDPSTSTY